MKDLKKGSWVLLIILFTGLFFHSCKEEKDPVPQKNYTYFVSNDFKFGVSSQEIKFKLNVAKGYYPEVVSFIDRVSHSIDIQKIIYNTKFQNQDIKASGLVLLPRDAGNYPVLCFQNGTNTQHDQAPSVNLNSEMLVMLESLSSMGFIVVIPDYIGFGESSNLPHPYLHAQSTTQSILDLLRAMGEYTSDENVAAKPIKDLYIYGYSQGGWATMLLQKEIETKYSSEFNLVASSCAAGPYSLEFMNKYITEKTDYPMPYFLTYVLNAYTSIGLVPNPISDFIKAPYAVKIPTLYNGTLSGSSINAALTTKMADLLTLEYKDQYATNAKFSALIKAFADNSVVPWAISTPTRLFHGIKDDLIPVEMSQKIFNDLKAKGTLDAKIQLIQLPDVGHTNGVIPVSILTILWFLELKK